MAVTVRDSWTDERLDDFKDNIDHRFDEVDRRFDRAECEIRELRVEMHAGFDALNARFDAMQRTMIVGFAGIAASIVGALLVVPH